MSYHNRARFYHAMGRSPRAFLRRGLGDDAAPNISGDIETQLAALRRWSPTGFFTPAQILQIYDSVRAAQAALEKPMTDYLAADWTPSKDSVSRILNSARSAFSGFVPYVQAAGQAQLAGKNIVNAPALKATVLGVFTSYKTALIGLQGVESIDRWSKNLYGGVAAAAILGPLGYITQGKWVTSIFTDTIFPAIQSAVSVITKVAGIAWAVVKTVANDAIQAVSAVPTLLTYLKWGGIAFGALWIIRELKDGHYLDGIL